MSKTKKPTKSFRAGNVRAAIWTNQSEGGADYFSVTVSRSYRDDSEEWKESTVFGRDDLPKVELVTRKAYEYIQLEAGQSRSEKFTDRVEQEEQVSAAKG